jgi:signal transduction histidine kinase
VRGFFDRDVLRRAIENLVTNAAKYGAEARPITITVRSSHGRALVMVHNHGAHIPTEAQETLFRAFQRNTSGKDAGKRGWGIGLAQVRAAAESHGGSVGIDSVAGRGTTFTLDIPVDSRPLQPAKTTKP